MPGYLGVKMEGPIEIEADHLVYNKDEQLYQAHGNVEVVQGDFSLKADHARLSAVTNEVVAWAALFLKRERMFWSVSGSK